MPPRTLSFKSVAGKADVPKPVVTWDGPENPGKHGGITQSMISRFLADRERFRVHYIEGLVPIREFNHRLFFGECWHICEEVYQKNIKDKGVMYAVNKAVNGLVTTELVKFRTDVKVAEQIVKWSELCKKQFPSYVDYWKRHPDMKARKCIHQEHEFHVPYTLPNGRVVYLRGKQDSTDSVSKKVWLQENKTKGEIREGKIEIQLKNDLQTMFYVVALLTEFPDLGSKFEGVRYNVIRRPLSGGRYTVYPRKAKKPGKKGPGKAAETRDEFYNRVGGLIAGDPAFFFKRWNVPVEGYDIAKFRHTVLDPLLSHICQWYDAMKSCMGNPLLLPNNSIHWQHPYGCYNPLDEGAATPYDDYVQRNFRTGLKHNTETLFPELKG